MDKSILDFGINACYVALAYFGPLFILEYVHEFGKRIKSQEELENVVSEEGTKLGMNTDNIQTVLNSRYTAICYRLEEPKSDKEYALEIGNRLDSRATRMKVKHELRHIQKGHCDKQPKNYLLERLDYFFRREPQAVLYATLELKI